MEEVGIAGNVLIVAGIGMDAVEKVGLLVVMRREKDEVDCSLQSLNELVLMWQTSCKTY